MKALLIIIGILYFLILTAFMAKCSENFRFLIRTKGKSIKKTTRFQKK